MCNNSIDHLSNYNHSICYLNVNDSIIILYNYVTYQMSITMYRMLIKYYNIVITNVKSSDYNDLVYYML